MISIEEFISEIRERASQGNGPRMGWSCTFVPVEILDAGGIASERILPPAFSMDASSYLDPNFCPFIKTVLAKAIDNHYSHLSGIVLVNTCDGMRRLGDAWAYYCPKDFIFMLDVPRLRSQSAIRLFEEQLRALIKSIENHFGVRIDDDRLSESISQRNRLTYLLKRLFLLQGGNGSLLTYSHLLELINLGFQIPPETLSDELERLIKELGPASIRKSDKNGIKVMVSGSMQCGTGIIRFIEKMGAEVVETDFCTGGRYLKKIREDIPPLKALSYGYIMETRCARMFDSEPRLSLIKDAIQKKGVRGIIHVSMKFCDTYLYEANKIKAMLDEIGVPSLFLEVEYSDRLSGSLKTRLQAFMELLEGYER